MLENHINIHVIGTVSAGKSTFINTLFANYITPVSLKKCTMNPQSYKEPLPQKNEIEQKEEIDNIYNNNIMTNKKLYENGINEIIPNIYDVDLFTNLFDNDRQFRINITDFPGINDSTTKNKYTDYITKKSLDIDIIIMIIDITSGLNTSDELDILDMIQTHIIKKNSDNLINTKLIILINKCDDLMNNNLNNTEHEALFEQINKVIQEKKIICHIIPISCKNILINMLLLENFEKLNNLDINYVGNSYFGNIYWNKLTHDQKRDRLQDYVKNNKEEIFNNIDNNGFNNFKKVINSVINDNLIDLKKNQEIRNLLPIVSNLNDCCEKLLLKIMSKHEENIDLEEYIINYIFPELLPLKTFFSEEIWNIIKDKPKKNGSTLFLKHLKLKLNKFKNEYKNIQINIRPLLFLIFDIISNQYDILGIKTKYEHLFPIKYIEPYHNYIKNLLQTTDVDIYNVLKYFKHTKLYYIMLSDDYTYLNNIQRIILSSNNFKLLFENNFNFIDNLFNCLNLTDKYGICFILYRIYHIYYDCICNQSVDIRSLSYKKIYLLNELYNKKLDYKIYNSKHIIGIEYLRKIKYIINLLFTLKNNDVKNTPNYITKLLDENILTDNIYFKLLEYDESDFDNNYKLINNNLDKIPSVVELKLVNEL